MKEATTSAEISRAPIQERNSQHRVEEAMRKLSVAFTARFRFSQALDPESFEQCPPAASRRRGLSKTETRLTAVSVGIGLRGAAVLLCDQ
jgi:hypothetical protein